ncbi:MULTISPECIES: RkpR, polysaccharide export protein [Alphaproteobacteria]|uniref:RkpR, polysaccharide export protein n=2 Tax=Alphaproteobacteria TaxID=28211 RepID=A0A512HJS9_9HYPH|nr:MULTISPECIES: RkpR, polysaccharide export protein [Alphaproteobacteria]GEO85691.1 RkpR, polysaccharide export protein [Ciceribacter naphthalenivorans]GLR21950.1 RkpR, polysaccharide export protein [Ciceribacter naphthalenivorans]GLT04806.1 RkpR, polysaccharide export protein [Sphingomonas psychrolutea]
MAIPENAAGSKIVPPKLDESSAKPKQHPNVRILEGLLDESKRKGRAVRLRKISPLLKIRHLVIIAAFVVLVAIPSTLASLYLAFVAQDQYHSSASFAVRSIISSAGASDIMGMFTQTTAGSTVADSYILMDYLLSERMVEDVDSRFDLDATFAPRGGDYFFGLAAGQPIEDKLNYWRRMITVDFDNASGILQLHVRAFDPKKAQEIASFILTRCEILINDLSTTAHEETLKLARQEITIAEKRLTDARMALREFRDVSQDVDPVEGAKLAVQLVAGMEQQLAKLNAELEVARSQMAEDTPRIRVIKTQISALESRIETEKQRIGSGIAEAKTDRTTTDLTNSDVSGRLQLYEKLQLEHEFGEKTYAGALASLEKARIDATGKQRYLAVFIQPTLSQMAQYPNRLLYAVLVFLGGMFVWGMATLLYYNIRDRA